MNNKPVTITSELIPTLKLALPMMLTQLLGLGQQIIDTVMAGKHSALTLAGVSLAGQFFTLVYLLMVGIGIGVSAQISRHHGHQDSDQVRFTFQQSLWLFAAMGGITTLALIGCAWLPELIGSAPDIAVQAKRYLLTIAAPAGIFVFGHCARYFFEGMAHPQTNNLVQGLLLPVNILGNWYFLNHTDLGTLGMAIATGISYCLYTVFLLRTLGKDRRWHPYQLFQKLPRPDKATLSRLLDIGFPIGLSIVIEAGLFVGIGMLVSRSNEINTSANQIAINYASIMFMLPLGVASALTIRISNALGQDNWPVIRARAYGGIGLCTAIMLASGIIMVLFGTHIAELYTNNNAVIAIAANILLVTALFQLVDGIQIAASGVLRGLADTKIIILYTFIGFWVLGFPFGLLFAYIFGWGIYGLWGGCCIGLAFYALMGTRRVIRHIRHHAQERSHG